MNKPTIEKSQEQAEIIKMIALPIMMLDTEYCKEVSKELLQQANRQESLAVLNPNYPLVKNDIIRKQAKALSLLCQYIETLKEIEKSKIDLSKEQKNRDNISEMFL